MFRSAKPYRNFFRKESVRQFESREKAYEYMEKEVFVLNEFSVHVTEVSKTLEISYLLAYEIITNYLTDILYELDIAVSARKKRMKISVHAYFYLDIGFMLSTKNKKMFLEKIIKN